MKVIFLDIDGVLVCYDSLDHSQDKPKLPRDEKTKMHKPHVPAMKNLNRIIEETGAFITPKNMSPVWHNGCYIAVISRRNK